MTSLSNPKSVPSVPPTNKNTTKNSSPSPTKKEVQSNTTSRTSNGNTSKPIILKKKEPTHSSPIKRKKSRFIKQQ